MTFDHKLAVVTGAGSGLGRAIALALGGRAARVAVIDLDGDSAAETVELITKAGGLAEAFQGDTSVAEDLNRTVTAAVTSFGPLEIMINNAGIVDDSNVDQLDEAIWRRVVDIDLTGVFLGSKRALQEMLPRKSGRIINMASVAGLNGTGGGAAYVAAKHGVVGLTRQMAVAYSAQGVTINAVCPGPIHTNLNQHSKQILGLPSQDASSSLSDERLRQIVPAGRWGTAEDVASAVCYLASEEAAYVTGHTMVVDGGFSAR